MRGSSGDREVPTLDRVVGESLFGTEQRTAVLKNRAKWTFWGKGFRGVEDGRINLKCKDSEADVN